MCLYTYFVLQIVKIEEELETRPGITMWSEDKSYTEPSCSSSSQNVEVQMQQFGNACCCPYCTYKTNYLQNLKRHILLKHTEGKPFECSTCKKRFKLKGRLKEHVRIHTGEKPFKCPVCSKSFTHGNTFRWHLRLTHRDYTPKCKTRIS